MKAGWQKQRLTAVTVKITDGSHNPPKGVAESNYLMLSSKNVFDDDLHYADPRYLTADQYQQEDKRTGVVPDDVLLTIVGTIGRSAVVPTDAPRITLQRSVAVIRPNRQFIEPRFLMYSFIERCAELNEQARGVAQKGIYLESLRELELMLPSLPEQQRIVGVLDEAFAGIATARANAEKNLQNARALFESHLQSVFTERGEGWVEKPFEELIESDVIGLTKNSREQGEDLQYPYVKMNNITRDNRFDFSSFTNVNATADEVAKFSLRNGDFLFNTRNSYELVGKSCIYESDSDDVVLFNNNIMRVRFTNGIDARFVLLAFASKAVADELNSLKSGTTNVSAIYFKDLRSLIVPVPPIAAQRQIAAKLDALAAATQRLEGLYQQKLAALEALKKSLLHRAFSGEL